MSETPKTKDAKAVLAKLLQEAGGMTSLRLGSTIHLTTADNIANVYADLVKKAIRTGEAIHHNDGSREFYEWVEVFDASKGFGSDAYTWHKDGHRCKHQLVKTVVQKDKTYTKTVVKTAWRAQESV